MYAPDLAALVRPNIVVANPRRPFGDARPVTPRRGEPRCVRAAPAPCSRFCPARSIRRVEPAAPARLPAPTSPLAQSPDIIEFMRNERRSLPRNVARWVSRTLDDIPARAG